MLTLHITEQLPKHERQCRLESRLWEAQRLGIAHAVRTWIAQAFAFWPWLKKPKPVSALNTAALVPQNPPQALQWLPAPSQGRFSRISRVHMAVNAVLSTPDEN